MKDKEKAIDKTDIKKANQMNQNKNIMKKLKYIFALICIACIVVIDVYKKGIFTSKSDSIISKEDGWCIKEVTIEQDTTEGNTTVIPRWETLSISQQFYRVEYNSSTYSSRKTKIPNNNILRNIGNATLTSYDIYNKTTHSKKGDVYSIKDISEKCAIAIKFEGNTDYYVYVNSHYTPKTLGEFIDDLNLEENISFETVNYKYRNKDSKEIIDVMFYDVDNEIIWQKLFSNKDLENIYSIDTMEREKYTSEIIGIGSEKIGISVNIPLLGYKKISVSLTDKGYLITNILDTGKGFYIGENKVQEFINYVKKNYEGYKIVYIYENIGTENNAVD